MAYVPVPKDLTQVKSKVMLNLTKRQIICFGGGALIGVPFFFLLRGPISSGAAAMVMIFIMMPFFLFALYERNGQPLEKVLHNAISSMIIRPKQRPYLTCNLYATLMQQDQIEKEVRQIVRKTQKKTNPK